MVNDNWGGFKGAIHKFPLAPINETCPNTLPNNDAYVCYGYPIVYSL